MSSLSRKLRRKKKRQSEKDLQEKLGLFDKLSDHCDACERPYDKEDKEMVTTWNVVVREKEEVVRLYCPPCWDKAKEFIKKLKEKSNVQEDV